MSENPTSPESTDKDIPHEIEFGHEATKFLRESLPQDFSERRLELLQWDEEKWIGYLKTIHSVMRGNGLQEDEFDGQTVRIGGMGDESFYDPPVFEAREDLLKESFKVAQGILESTAYDDKLALEHAGALLNNAVVMVHPYRDGNGRTGRLVHAAFAMEQKSLADVVPELLKERGGVSIAATAVEMGSYAAQALIDEVVSGPSVSDKEKMITAFYCGSRLFAGDVGSPWPEEVIADMNQKKDALPISDEEQHDLSKRVPGRYVLSYLKLAKQNPLVFLPAAGAEYMDRTGNTPLQEGEYPFLDLQHAWLRNLSKIYDSKTREQHLASVGIASAQNSVI